MSALSRESLFEDLSCDQQYALAVRAGLPIYDLLELGSCRLAEVLELLREQAGHDMGISQNTLYIVRNQIEMAKAMIDACSSGLVSKRGAEEVQP
ncbi:hypothetical protein [Pseudomonas schmalbachii]|uniref:DUF3077 domain-containing protein n=1 Tax=Pseudomonas schmalbachii TaxID=2816993 RepID=A0ABS3TL07_9PSED|nr:hypothetical protein [Pseudomonas schmalbachii]MBO3274088.1 hypothetical protein [Pseudomonas schmalbachii]